VLNRPPSFESSHISWSWYWSLNTSVESGYLQHWEMFLSTAQMRRVSKPQHDIHLRIFNEDVYRWIHVRPTSLRTKGEFFPGRARLEEVVQMPVEITECGFEFPPAGQAYFYCAQN